MILRPVQQEVSSQSKAVSPVSVACARFRLWVCETILTLTLSFIDKVK